MQFSTLEIYKKALVFSVLLLTGSAAYSQQDYEYDADGNPTKDVNKGIDSIYYNHLNLVERVVIKDKGEIRYSYDALGNKLSKTVLTSEDTTTRYYAGGFEYTDDRALELINMEEGQLLPDGAAFRPVYVLKDHLGNGRVSFDVNGITQVDSYYPFGLQHPDKSFKGEVENRYGYNGKERQDDLGFAVINYGSRMYDPALARWNGVDKQAAKYLNLSPFAYVANNPLIYIDPNGEEIVFHKTASEDFKMKYQKAVAHLRKHGLGKIIDNLEKSTTVYTLVESPLHAEFLSGLNFIYWDPLEVHVTNLNYKLSPAEVLYHELAHAAEYDSDKEKFLKDARTSDPEYTDAGEKSVVTDEEQDAARKLGKLKKGQVTRKDHQSKDRYDTDDPTSTKKVSTDRQEAKSRKEAEERQKKWEEKLKEIEERQRKIKEEWERAHPKVAPPK